MHKNFINLCSIAFLCLAAPAPLCAQIPDIRAQDAWELREDNWQKKLDNIRNSSADLLETYQKLRDEYQYLSTAHKQLHDELIPLREEVAVREQEVDLLKSQPSDDDEGYNWDDVKDGQTRLDKMEAENAEMRQRLQLLRDQNFVLEEEMASALQEAGTRGLERKPQRAKPVASTSSDDPRTDGLRQQLNEALREQRMLEDEAEDWEQKIKQMEMETRDIEARNASARETIKRLRSQMPANDAGRAAAKAALKPLLKEKKVLNDSIARLEDELQQMKQDIGGASKVVRNKQELMDQIIELNTENQHLREQLR